MRLIKGREEGSENPAVGQEELEHAVEALLFASSEPLALAHMASVIAKVLQKPEPELELLKEAIHSLNQFYETSGRSFRIEHWAGGYSLATIPAVASYVEELHSRERPRQLSRTLLETLAIISYKQPVSKAELDFVRGVDSDYAVRKLLEMGFVDVVGRSESLGRPLLYGTTQLFLDRFGLASLEDLPRLREIEELLNDPAFSKERARMLFTNETPRIEMPLDSGESGAEG